ncbi:Proline-rich region [Prochlorococcus marinus str. MIT 9303]|uniref:Proline-rich region n=1 Tax=Prochlorococcus marinus (strain MIT 9303) TaxID=59922 RepID=A2CDD9_PROM3|nr:Proline-rich region [Prochlorococcus marinus str. MIT 9303]
MLDHVAKPSPTEQKNRKRPRFWLGPLLVGGCFALGYGMTQRIMILRGNTQQPQQQSFGPTPLPFPGERLEGLRRRHGGSNADLQADVAAKEAKITAKRKTKEQAEKQAKQQAEKLAAAAALRREQELQAIRQATETDSADPGLADPALAAPELPAPINPQGTRPAQPVAPKPKPARTPASDSLGRPTPPQPVAPKPKPARTPASDSLGRPTPPQPVAPKPKPSSTPASDFLRRRDSPQRPHSPVSDFLRRNYP